MRAFVFTLALWLSCYKAVLRFWESLAVEQCLAPGAAPNSCGSFS